MTKLASEINRAALKDPNIAHLLAQVLGVVTTTKTTKAKSVKRGKGRKVAAKVAPELRKAAFAIAAVEAAKARGFLDAQANVNLFTYGKWEERGFVVKKGEKAIRVATGRGAGLPLFHRSQVEPVLPEETAQPVQASEVQPTPMVS